MIYTQCSSFSWLIVLVLPRFTAVYCLVLPLFFFGTLGSILERKLDILTESAK